MIRKCKKHWSAQRDPGGECMRGKVIYRIAAGTCGVCITYSLMMQAVHGESPSQSASGVWRVNPSAVTAQAASDSSRQAEYLTDSRQAPADPWYTDYSYSDRKRGKQRGGKDRHGDMPDGYDSVYGNSGAYDGQASPSAEREKQRAGISGDQNDQSSISAVQSNASGDPPTLQQYLSLLRCSGCRHNCCLLSPRCMKGRTKQKNATAQYQTTYGGSDRA